ncbi:MAG: hypothetical protein ISS74_08825, partial [Planctomycetes bacterium]|nr:hypothetical protein [Planctomycetota bacterium]
MTAAGRILAYFDRRISPIVVKELRQAVRSRFIVGMFLFFLGVELLIVGLYLLAEPTAAQSMTGGSGLAAWLYGLLTFVCVILVPAYSGIRLAWERSGVQSDLLFTTTISAGSIIRGKLLTAVILIALLYSAFAPFIVLTYLLRGVDLLEIAMALGLTFIYGMAASQFALLLGSVQTGTLGKVFMGLFALGAIIGAPIVLAVLTFTVSLGGPGPVYGGSPNMWAVQGTFAAITLAGTGFLYTLSVALLMPPSANRMRPVRLYLTALWLVLLGGAVLWWVLGDADEFVMAWAFVFESLFVIVMLIAVSERETLGTRVRRHIPRRILPRMLAFLTTSGAAGGLTWAVLMSALTLVVIALLHDGFGALSVPEATDTLLGVGGLALYGLAYSLTALVLRRLFLSKRLRLPPQHTWLLALALAMIGSL